MKNFNKLSPESQARVRKVGINLMALRLQKQTEQAQAQAKEAIEKAAKPQK